MSNDSCLWKFTRLTRRRSRPAKTHFTSHRVRGSAAILLQGSFCPKRYEESDLTDSGKNACFGSGKRRLDSPTITHWYANRMETHEGSALPLGINHSPARVSCGPPNLPSLFVSLQCLNFGVGVSLLLRPRSEQFCLVRRKSNTFEGENGSSNCIGRASGAKNNTAQKLRLLAANSSDFSVGVGQSALTDQDLAIAIAQSIAAQNSFRS